MSYLVATALLLAVLCLFNLMIMSGAKHQLRQHTVLVDRSGPGPGERGVAPPELGTSAATARTTESPETS